jgi:hypothetical protein
VALDALEDAALGQVVDEAPLEELVVVALGRVAEEVAVVVERATKEVAAEEVAATPALPPPLVIEWLPTTE